MPCASPWEALRGDPLPWLLDPQQPNLHWRALVELVGRPAASPAVLRARGGANAAEPIASLLAQLRPDGGWDTEAALWGPGRGPGWRLLAAAQLGADPTDPRLQAAAQVLLDEAPGASGFALAEVGPDRPWLTARVLEALAGLGWRRHPRFEEALAWLEDQAPSGCDGAWIAGDGSDGTGCHVTPVALLAALTAGGDGGRRALRERALDGALRVATASDLERRQLGHPNLGRSDAGEALWGLARAGAELRPAMVPALEWLQGRQLEGGRWPRDVATPEVELPLGVAAPSRWLTLRSAVVMLRYALPAGLPRVFPQRPRLPTP
jgi:hypothetical protein